MRWLGKIGYRDVTVKVRTSWRDRVRYARIAEKVERDRRK